MLCQQMEMPDKFTQFSQVPTVDVTAAVKIQPLTGERLQVVRSEIEAGAEFAPHRHPHEQFVVVLSGAIEFEIDGERRTLGPMGVFYFEPDVPHGARVSDEGVEILEVFSPPREDYREGATGVDHDVPR